MGSRQAECDNKRGALVSQALLRLLEIDWIKFKVLHTEDCVVCGYILKSGGMTSIIIGQYDGDELVYKGHVTLGSTIKKLGDFKIQESSPFAHTPPGNSNAVWLVPELVCIVEYMPSDKEGYRQATFKGIRDDKAPEECKINYQD